MPIMLGRDASDNLVALLLDTSGKVILLDPVNVQLVAGGAVIGHVIVDSGAINATLQTGSNVIGHVIADASGAVIGHVIIDSLPNVNATLLTGSNLVGKVDINSIPVTHVIIDTGGNVIGHAIIDSGSINATLQAGTAVIGHVINDAGSALIGKVDINSIPTTQVQSTQADKLFSYYVSQAAANGPVTLAAGTNSLNIYTVPASRVYKIMNISAQYNGTITNVVLAPKLTIGGVNIYMGYTKPIVSGQWYIWPVNAVLAAGDSVNLDIVNATLNDTAYDACNGYLMHNT
jgi:hypothetical protein